MQVRFILLFLLTLTFVSCKKKPIDEIVVEGNVRLQVSVMHHTWPIGGINVYLKKDTTEWPGKDSTLYNFSTTTGPGGIAEFRKLFPGNYYVFATGYDSLFAAHVIGHSPVVLDTSTISNNEVDITLFVSE